MTIDIKNIMFYFRLLNITHDCWSNACFEHNVIILCNNNAVLALENKKYRGTVRHSKKLFSILLHHGEFNIYRLGTLQKEKKVILILSKSSTEYSYKYTKVIINNN